jgi:ABC-type transport system involved in multi-copper enzyme maturation permease subunit
MNLVRAWIWLWRLSLRRLVWSKNTLMVAFPLALAALFLWRRNYPATEPAELAFEDFGTEFVIFILSAFLVPVCALAFATTSIGGDREDRTLLFLLIRPIPRPLILLAKISATLPLCLGLTLGSFFLYGRMAGETGEQAFQLFWPAVASMTVAYVCLFHLFAVAFRHATIIALVYALFMEFFIGNMPGIIKRVAVNYYGRSMIYDYGAAAGLDAPDPEWFVPLSAASALQVLAWLSLAAAILAAVIFARREYRDLT